MVFLAHHFYIPMRIAMRDSHEDSLCSVGVHFEGAGVDSAFVGFQRQAFCWDFLFGGCYSWDFLKAWHISLF